MRNNAVNWKLAAIVTAVASGCAHAEPARAEHERVAVRTLYESPERWDGRKVEVSGVAVRQREDYGLYASRADMCSSEPIAIYVDWYSARLPNRFRRVATVRGVFRNRQGLTRPSGEVLLSNAAPGPGPLEGVSLVRWRGPAIAACSSR